MKKIAEGFLEAADRFSRRVTPINGMVNTVTDFVLPKAKGRAICEPPNTDGPVYCRTYVYNTECRSYCGYLDLGNGYKVCRYTEHIWYRQECFPNMSFFAECDDPCYHGCGSQYTKLLSESCPPYWPGA